MYLGNNFGIIALNNFVTGFMIGAGQLYGKKPGYPDFSLFTAWLGGILKYNYESSPMNWSWLLLDKYKDDKKALKKFFFYLKQFQSAKIEVIVIPLAKTNIEYAVEHKANHLWCGVGKVSKSYYSNLKKIDKIVLFQLKPSRTLFSLLVNKDNKLLDARNTDMTNRVLLNKIEEQFGIDHVKRNAINFIEGTKILQRFKII